MTTKFRRTILGVVAAACAVLAIPASANAAQVHAFGQYISVLDAFDVGEFAEDITITQSGSTTQIVNNSGNPAEPLLLKGEDPTIQPPVPDSGQIVCSQDSARQVTCTRVKNTNGLPTSIGVTIHSGNDKVTIGPHSTNETVGVSTGSGDDSINVENGSADTVHCGDGVDTVWVGGLDTLVPDIACETLISGGIVSGAGAPIPTAPVAPAKPAKMFPGPRLSPHKGKIVASVKVNGPGLVTGKATKGDKLLAKGSKTATVAGIVKVTLKPTKAAKRLLKRKPKVTVRLALAFKPTTGATVTKVVSARLRR